MAKKKKSTTRSIAQRLSALPKPLNDLGVRSAKYHATACKAVIEDGLRKANLVDKLLDITLSIKRKLGAKRVITPLMFSGDSDKLSMINGLKVIKAEKRYKLVPYGKHRSGQSQKLIWAIHEKGAIIPVTDKMRKFWAAVFGVYLSTAKKFILIKPRFPIKKGLIRYLRSKEKIELNLEIKKAMRDIIAGTKDKKKSAMAEWEKRAQEASAK